MGFHAKRHPSLKRLFLARSSGIVCYMIYITLEMCRKRKGKNQAEAKDLGEHNFNASRWTFPQIA